MLITFSRFQLNVGFVNIYLNRPRPISRGQLAHFNENRLSIFLMSFTDKCSARLLTLEMTPVIKCANIYEWIFRSLATTPYSTVQSYDEVRTSSTRWTSFVHYVNSNYYLWNLIFCGWCYIFLIIQHTSDWLTSPILIAFQYRQLVSGLFLLLS